MDHRARSSPQGQKTIKFSCPRCGAKLRAPRSAAGHKGKCQKCGAPIRLRAFRDESPGTYPLKEEPAEKFRPVIDDTGSMPEIDQSDCVPEDSENAEDSESAEHPAVLDQTQAFSLWPRKAWSQAPPSYVCAQCGSVGQPKPLDRGHSTTAIVLWALFTAPGLLGTAASTIGFVLNARDAGAYADGSSLPVLREIEFGLLAIACLIYALPGVLYPIATMTTRFNGCPICKSPQMIPCDTPYGRSLLNWVEREVDDRDPVDRPAEVSFEPLGAADQ